MSTNCSGHEIGTAAWSSRAEKFGLFEFDGCVDMTKYSLFEFLHALPAVQNICVQSITCREWATAPTAEVMRPIQSFLTLLNPAASCAFFRVLSSAVLCRPFLFHVPVS